MLIMPYLLGGDNAVGYSVNSDNNSPPVEAAIPLLWRGSNSPPLEVAIPLLWR